LQGERKKWRLPPWHRDFYRNWELRRLQRAAAPPEAPRSRARGRPHLMGIFGFNGQTLQLIPSSRASVIAANASRQWRASLRGRAALQKYGSGF
jgi:hypothetical protein